MSELQQHVRNNYKQILENPEQSIISVTHSSDIISASVGYSPEDLALVPEEANLGLGCGNPIPAAALQEREIVVDLGAGPGLDCFLAGVKVGHRGRAIGIDMTPEMVETARRTAKKHKIRNVEFRLGEIEYLPVANDYADVCISNCVINLSANKGQVYREIYRVLKPGGRISICDIVIMQEIPQEMKEDEAMHSC